MFKYFTCLFMLLCYIPYSSSAVNRAIYSSNQDQGDSHLFCFCDEHTESQESVNQRFDFLAAAKACNAHVIIEDTYCDNSRLNRRLYYFEGCNELPYVKNLDLYHFPLEMLFGMSFYCKMLGISFTNIEFRGCKCCDREFKKAHVVSENIASEIAAYNDDSVLNKYYSDILKTYHEYACLAASLIEIVERFIDEKNTILPQYCTQFTEELNRYVRSIDNFNISILSNRYLNEHKFLTPEEAQRWAKNKAALWCLEEKVEHFLNLYDSGLIEARIVHEIYNSNHPVIFVYAGGSHIKNIASVLEKLGFKTKPDEIGQIGSAYNSLDLITFFVKSLGAGFLKNLAASMHEVLNGIETNLQECEERVQWLDFIKEKRDSMALWNGKYASSESSSEPEISQNPSILPSQPSRWFWWRPSLAVTVAAAVGIIIAYKTLFKR